MKSLIKCPHSGQYSSKRILSLVFGAGAIALPVICLFVKIDPIVAEWMPRVIMGLLFLCGGLQGLTTNAPWGSGGKGLNKDDKNE